MELAEIGQKLKAARENRNLSLSQIYERTKIPIVHLQSIDSGDKDSLPEPVYIAGFIKRYADCVGLNGQSLSDEYRHEYANQAPQKDDSWAIKGIAQPIFAHNISHPKVSIGSGMPNILKSMFGYGFILVVVAALLSFLINQQSNTSLNQQEPSAALLNRKYTFPNATTVGQAPSLANLSPAAIKDGTAPPTNDTEAQIALTASKHVWVEVKALSDDQSLYTGNLEPGERRDFKDPTGLKVRAGDGGSISVEYQGKVETLGAAQKVAEKSFMIKNITASNANGDASKQALSAAKPAVAKKPVKKPLASDIALRHRAKIAEDHGGTASAPPSKSIDVPYRYTESRSDND